MVSHWFVMLLVLASSFAFADCGDITKGLFGIEIGGPRTYLNSLPAGLSLSPIKQESLTSGVDSISGKRQPIDLMQAQIIWHENRVIWVMAIIRGVSEAEIEDIRSTIIRMSGTDILPKTVPPNQFLRCGDGLQVHIVKSQVFSSRDSPTPLLVLDARHSKLKSEMESSIRPRDQEEKVLIAAAEGGDARAQVILAKSLSDRTQARQWLRRAAEAGYAEGQYELGYSLGILSDPESWSWFEKAALQGYEQALNYVRGVMMYRICEPQYGQKYLDFLKATVAGAAQHEKMQKSAQAALDYAIRFRERSPNTCK